MTIIIDGTVGANKAVVLDANGKLPAIDGSLVTTLNATQVTTGSIATANIDTGTTTGKVLVLDGSGAMPAIAAGAMTGVSSATKSASDPTVSTNPSTGLGTKWINTTSGEIFILTDATAGENVWTSTGGTSGDVTPWVWQGTTYGYTSGGFGHGHYCNHIAKWSFTSDGNATAVGTLTQGRDNCSGTSSETYGFTAGGGGPTTNIIDKFSFSSDGNAVDHGDLYTATSNTGGAGSITHGYIAGNNTSGIQKWLYATLANATEVGNLSVNRNGSGNASGSDYGYEIGSDATPYNNVIDRFAFASDGNAVDVGDLHTGGSFQTNNSTTHAYTDQLVNTGVVQKYALASSGNATSLGSLMTVARAACSPSSSTSYGYWTSGWTGSDRNIIDKMSYASEGNATDVGDIPTVQRTPCGQQV